MSQLDGIKGTGLQRIELAYSGGSYKFNVNPQSISYDMPHRATVVKTQQQYVIEDFNDDVQTVTIKGNTGGPRSGAEDAKNKLWNFLDAYANREPKYGQAPTENLIFLNHTEDFAWEVTIDPSGYSITRDVSHPLMWDYEMKFIVIKVAGGPTADAPFENEVTSWIYDSSRYQDNNRASLANTEMIRYQDNNRTSLANTEMSRIVPTSTKSLYSPMMNYNDLGTGKEKGTAQRNSKTGTTRAKSSLGIR